MMVVAWLMILAGMLMMGWGVKELSKHYQESKNNPGRPMGLPFYNGNVR